MLDIPKYKQTRQIGDVNVNVESDKIDGEILDTAIQVEPGVICWIAGNKIDEFFQELNNVVQKYRI